MTIGVHGIYKPLKILGFGFPRIGENRDFGAFYEIITFESTQIGRFTKEEVKGLE